MDTCKVNISRVIFFLAPSSLFCKLYMSPGKVLLMQQLAEFLASDSINDFTRFHLKIKGI